MQHKDRLGSSLLLPALWGNVAKGTLCDNSQTRIKPRGKQTTNKPALFLSALYPLSLQILISKQAPLLLGPPELSTATISISSKLRIINKLDASILFVKTSQDFCEKSPIYYRPLPCSSPNGSKKIRSLKQLSPPINTRSKFF